VGISFADDVNVGGALRAAAMSGAAKFRINFPGSGGLDLIGLDGDPTTGSGAVAAIGSLGLRFDVPALYQKTGATNTEWTIIEASSGPVTASTLTLTPAFTAAPAGVQHNYGPSGSSASSIWRLAPGSGAGVQATITGIALPGGNPDGRVLWVMNTGAGALELTNLDGSSLAANQLSLPGASNWLVQPGDTMPLVYDATALLWRGIGTVDVPQLLLGTDSVGSGALTVSGTAEVLGATSLFGATTAGPTFINDFNIPVAVDTFTGTGGATIDNFGAAQLADYASLKLIRFDASDADAYVITGFTAPSESFREMYLLFLAPSAGTLTLDNLSGGSAATNQIQCPGGANLALVANQLYLLVYDGILQKWVVQP
jgi:hypothetical protein